MRKNSFNKNSFPLFEIGKQQFASPSQLTMSVIQSKWKLNIILLLLAQKSYRYGEIKKAMTGTITHKMLVQSLRQLENDGLVRRRVYPQVPPRVEYTLTVHGKRLSRVIDALEFFGMVYRKNEPWVVRKKELSIRDKK